MSEAKLIERGASYYAFLLDGERYFTRRLDDDSKDSLIMETIHYHTINEPQYLKNLVSALDEMNLPTGEDKKNPLLDVKVKPAFKQTDVWKYGRIYYNETVEVEDNYYDSLEKYGVDTTNDVVIPYISSLQEVGYKDTQVHEDFSNSYNVAVFFARRYLQKVMTRLSFYHFSNLTRYISLVKSREEFLEERWLNIYNRKIYVTVPQTVGSGALTPTEKLNILE